MRKSNGQISQSIVGGVLITFFGTPVLPFLAFPMLIFDPLFPPECHPEAFICLFSGKALLATLASEVLIYSLLIYFALRLGLIYLKKASYIGNV